MLYFMGKRLVEVLGNKNVLKRNVNKKDGLTPSFLIVRSKFMIAISN
jgi:hypothetical protein